MKLWIMQGASGSGKSTKAQEIAVQHDAVIHSTDNLFMIDGVYQFDAKLLGQKHAENLANAIESMKLGQDVIIDNTNTQCWECREYVRAAVRLRYEIEFVRCDGRLPNTHGVPEEKVEQMRQRMEELSIEKCMNALAPWERRLWIYFHIHVNKPWVPIRAFETRNEGFQYAREHFLKKHYCVVEREVTVRDGKVICEGREIPL